MRALEGDLEGKKAHSTFIVAVTGTADANAKQKCFDAGMDCFMPKPVKLSELETNLHSYALDRQASKLSKLCARVRVLDMLYPRLPLPLPLARQAVRFNVQT